MGECEAIEGEKVDAQTLPEKSVEEMRVNMKGISMLTWRKTLMHGYRVWQNTMMMEGCLWTRMKLWR